MLNALPIIFAQGGPADHVYNHVAVKSESGYWLWSGNQGVLVLSGLILTLGMLWVASKIKTGPKEQGADAYITHNKFAHMIEVICVYLREDVFRPLLGDRTNALSPFLWTFFFFILANNLLGLVPFLDLQHLFPYFRDNHLAYIGGTATQNIWITGMLAVLAGILFNLAALKRLGVGGYFKHMTGGAPLMVAPLIFVLEFAGQLVIKPAALAIRLFANMTAGHVLLATLLMFVGDAWKSQGPLVAAPITVVSVAGAIAISFLELFVAFLQAFVFTFLTAVFISLMDHHDEHGHEHGHDHAHGHEHAHA